MPPKPLEGGNKGQSQVESAISCSTHLTWLVGWTAGSAKAADTNPKEEDIYIIAYIIASFIEFIEASILTYFISASIITSMITSNIASIKAYIISYIIASIVAP